LKITSWRHKLNKRQKHTRTIEYKLTRNGIFDGWKMTSQLTSNLQKLALEKFKDEYFDSLEPEDVPIASCNCGCSSKLQDDTFEELLNYKYAQAPKTPAKMQISNLIN